MEEFINNVTLSPVDPWNTLFVKTAAAGALNNLIVTKLYLRPCSHWQSCSGTVPICRISRVCERAMSGIKLRPYVGKLNPLERRISVPA